METSIDERFELTSFRELRFDVLVPLLGCANIGLRASESDRLLDAYLVESVETFEENRCSGPKRPKWKIEKQTFIYTDNRALN